MGREWICPECRRAPHYLTFRERQIAKFISEGKRNRDIAWLLHLSEKTVRNHVSTIFDKLGVSSRLEVALWWIAEQAKKANGHDKAA